MKGGGVIDYPRLKIFVNRLAKMPEIRISIEEVQPILR
jgi:hypothetical protein